MGLLRTYVFRVGSILSGFPSSAHLVIENRVFGRRCGYGRRCLSNKPIKTMKDVIETLNKWNDSRIGWPSPPRDRSHLLQYLPKSQDELPPRALNDSYAEALIPLSTDLALQNYYSTTSGKVRMGRVMEDMDFFSVYIALKHLKNPLQKEGTPTPYVIVTAAVDDIEYTYEKPEVTVDVRLLGKVVCVGKSSMDICVILERRDGANWKKITRAHFTMVARNSTLTGSAFVNKLIPEGPEEEKEMKEAMAMKKRKTEEDKSSLLLVPPSPDEQKLIHQNFVKSVDLLDPTITKRILPEDHVWMEDTKLSTSIFPHPENRNHHNNVFGGYLMRLAMELGWMIAYTHSLQFPSLRYISNISFKKPVAIDSFLKVTGQVVYTEDTCMQINVNIELFDVKTQQVITTNSFHFTYETKATFKIVMPRTYQEALLWIEGRRHFKKYKP